MRGVRGWKTCYVTHHAWHTDATDMQQVPQCASAADSGDSRAKSPGSESQLYRPWAASSVSPGPDFLLCQTETVTAPGFPSAVARMK